MNIKKRYRRWLLRALFLNIAGIVFYSYYLLEFKIPDVIKVRVGCEESFDFSLPLQATTYVEDQSVVSIDQEPLPQNQLTLDLSRSFSVNMTESGSYQVDLKLLGITLKKIQVEAIENKRLMPGGMPVGIHISTNGVMILGTGEITDNQGKVCEPAKNIVKSGDYIYSIDGQSVSNIQEMTKIINESEGRALQLSVWRDDQLIDLIVQPVKTVANDYKIGVWIRDDTQGIGTLSFIDENNCFGALGHGITDIDTSLLIDIDSGGLYPASVYNIIKGENGNPGEMVGSIQYSQNTRFGKITKNTSAGIFGTLYDDRQLTYDESQAMEIGLKQDLHIGQAYIRCAVDGTVRDYEIQISSIDYNSHQKNKDFIIQITDPDLIEKTNGIIQGMSGSPIIQDGKFVGVVTHVFLNDCTRGYGIFIENMLAACQ